VALDGRPAAVRCGAIELHDESLLVPKRVDSHPADPGIDLGKGEPARITELEEALLKDAQDLCELGNVGVEGCPEYARTTRPLPSADISSRDQGVRGSPPRQAHGGARAA